MDSFGVWPAPRIVDVEFMALDEAGSCQEIDGEGKITRKLNSPTAIKDASQCSQ
jgi:hypothetical protein